MTKSERAWLLLVFDAMLPSGVDGRLRLGARDVPMERFLEHFEATAPLDIRLGLRAALAAVVLGAPALVGRATSFAGLSRDERRLALEKMAASPLYLVRELPMLLKVVACMGYAALPEVQRQMGLEARDADAPAWARGAS